jgi:hypothetical protein
MPEGVDDMLSTENIRGFVYVGKFSTEENVDI